MNLDTSLTLVNLARAFAGETQARTRYLLYAGQARREGLEALARTVELIAGNEFAHAREFFEHLTKDVTAPFNNINVDAGYPFQIATTPDNMRFAAEGENSEASVIYPAFAKAATSEGFERIAQLFTLTAGVERGHNSAFTEIAQRLTEGTLYRREKPVIWKCANCGFERIGTEAWDTCPLCSYGQGWVELNLDARV